MLLKIVTLLGTIVFYSFATQPAQTIYIAGQITDSSANPLKGASVKLKVTSISDTTDDNGLYVLTNIPSGIRRSHAAAALKYPGITGNFMHFSINSLHRDFHLSAYTLSGQCTGTMHASGFSPGTYSVDLISALHLDANGTYILHAKYNNERINFGKLLLVNGKIHSDRSRFSGIATPPDHSIEASIPAIDTIELSKPGLRTLRKPLLELDYQYSLNFKLVKNKIPYFRTSPDRIQYWAFTGEKYQPVISNYDDDDFSQLELELLGVDTGKIKIHDGVDNNDTVVWTPSPADTGKFHISIRVSDSNGAADTLDWDVSVLTVSGGLKVFDTSGISIDSARNVRIASYDGQIYCAFTERDPVKHYKYDTTFTINYDTVSAGHIDTTKKVKSIDSTKVTFYGISVLRHVNSSWEYVGAPCFDARHDTKLSVYDLLFDSTGTPYVSINGGSGVFSVKTYDKTGNTWVQLGAENELCPKEISKKTGPEIGFVKGRLHALFWANDTGSDGYESESGHVFIKEWNGTTWNLRKKSSFNFENTRMNIDDVTNGIFFDIRDQLSRIAFIESELKVFEFSNDSLKETISAALEGINTLAAITSMTQNKGQLYLSYTQNALSTVLSVDTIIQKTGTFLNDKWTIAHLKSDGTSLYALMMKNEGAIPGYAFQIRKFQNGYWLPIFGSTIKDLKFGSNPAYGGAKYNVDMEIINGVPYVAFVDKSAGNKINICKYQE